MKTLETARELIRLGCDEWRDMLPGMMEGEDDIQSDSWRAIHEDSIDAIMSEELLSDPYVLGCCMPWFIADITGLSVEEIERAQKTDGGISRLGALMAKHEREDAEVSRGIVSADGYGPHFAHYDGNEETVGDYYIFRTN